MPTPHASSTDQLIDDTEYEFTSAWALRGTEGRTIAKRLKEGWELHSQDPGTLRTEITFRRAKPKTVWQQAAAFLARHWSAFGRLAPKTQQVVVGSAVGLVLFALIGGIVLAGVLSERTSTPAASTEATAPSEPAETSTAAPTPAPETYAYQGVPYEIVVVDEDVTNARLTHYWVLTDPFDYSTDEYKNQIRLIVEDLARQDSTTDLMVDVVTDREIAEAEAFSTMEAFIEEYGNEYFQNTIPEKEATHWLASYRGGFDPDTAQPSSSPSAYEIIWWNPTAPEEIEQWKPALAG